MSDNEGSSHYASLLFLDQNHNSITGENINHHEDLEDASSDCYSVLLGQKHANWTVSVPVSGEKYLGYHHERNKFKNGFMPNKNYTERDRFIFKNIVSENSRDGSYARTSNNGVSQNDRCGNWGSSKYVPSRQNGERRDPGTNHYTMAWIKDQNR